MSRYCVSILLSMSLVGCASDIDPGELPGCVGKCDAFGTDDRAERHEFSPETLEHQLAVSSAMLGNRNQLTEQEDGSYRVVDSVQTLGDRQSLCPGERFFEQPAVGFCSATLVADNLIITAGHCIMGKDQGPANTQLKCDSMAVVFDFALEEDPANPDSNIDMRALDADDVYHCDEVLAAENSSEIQWQREHDYAVIRLDRPVTGRTPRPVRGGPTIDVGEALLQVGHPSGIPQKLAAGTVREKIDGRPYDGFAYEAELLGGGSGGGVFELTNGALMGMPSHYNGANYAYNSEQGCYTLAVCGVNATCNSLPGAYDTITMLGQLSDDVADLLTVSDGSTPTPEI